MEVKFFFNILLYRTVEMILTEETTHLVTPEPLNALYNNNMLVRQHSLYLMIHDSFYILHTNLKIVIYKNCLVGRVLANAINKAVLCR